MPSGFQQQASDRNLNFFKSAATPQHGQKADREMLKREAARPTKTPKPPQY